MPSQGDSERIVKKKKKCNGGEDKYPYGSKSNCGSGTVTVTPLSKFLLGKKRNHRGIMEELLLELAWRSASVGCSEDREVCCSDLALKTVNTRKQLASSLHLLRHWVHSLFIPKSHLPMLVPSNDQNRSGGARAEPFMSNMRLL